MFKLACAALVLGSFSTPTPACDYAGVYALIDDVVVRVDCRGSGLRVDRFGFPSYSLAPQGRDRFAAREGYWRFRRDAADKVIGFVERRDGRSFDWVRR